MKNLQQKWEQILKVMESSMKSHQYNYWLSGIQLLSADEEQKIIFAGLNDPFKVAYVAESFGTNLSKAAEMICGQGFRIMLTFDELLESDENSMKVHSVCFDGDDKMRLMLAVNKDIADEELVAWKLGEFAHIEEKTSRDRTLQEDVETLQGHLKKLNMIMPKVIGLAAEMKNTSKYSQSEAK